MFIGIYNYTVVATYLALASGVLGTVLASRGNIFWAVICLVISGTLDMFDGRIASTKTDRTKGEKLFGIQIDSLCDLVSFGILPAMIGVAAGMTRWYHIIIVIAYVLCAQIRLAYFNVDEMLRQKKTDEKRKFYAGMPVTTVALLLPIQYAIFAPFGPGAVKVGFILFLAISAILFILGIKIPKADRKLSLAMLIVGAVAVICLIFFKIFHVI